MKTTARKDIAVSLVIASLGALLTLWFWQACESFPPPTTNPDGTLDLKTIILDDRPLVLTFNWYTTSKVLLFTLSFMYTFSISLISRKLWRQEPCLKTGATPNTQK